ncbi:MAG: FecR domain-containing protein [Sphingomonas phyllosphaerae]|uniref:FecR family protein n=1 Tax=Sphingomonas phyllosphaerae TaxID=257003 RepID=UPI002FFC6477
MTGSQHDGAVEDAMDWAVRVADRDFTDWDGFTRWLEADPAHAARYDAEVAALAAVEAHVARLPPAPIAAAVRPAPARSRRPLRWAGAAVAAALAGVIGLHAWQDRAQPYAVETAAGERRLVALGDGSSIVLAGGTRVTLDRADPRRAGVERGEALFRIRHDTAHPFRVMAGDLALTDLGTVFDVKRASALTRVAVAEGAVLVDPDGAALRLDPGQAVSATGDRLTRSATEVADVGAWRDGRLAYDAASLTEVAADLSRELRRPVKVVPAIAARPFRGTLALARLRDDPVTLGMLLDVRVRSDAAGWTLEPLE